MAMKNPEHPGAIVREDCLKFLNLSKLSLQRTFTSKLSDMPGTQHASLRWTHIFTAIWAVPLPGRPKKKSGLVVLRREVE